jgi:hypothetical protein
MPQLYHRHSPVVTSGGLARHAISPCPHRAPVISTTAWAIAIGHQQPLGHRQHLLTTARPGLGDQRLVRSPVSGHHRQG